MGIYEFKRKIFYSFLLTLVLIVLFGFMFPPHLYAAGEEEGAGILGNTTIWVCFAAALAFGFGAVGAAVAISNVGTAAMGAISEKPEIATNALIFIALAEGLVVFGFITALMILGNA